MTMMKRNEAIELIANDPKTCADNFAGIFFANDAHPAIYNYFLNAISNPDLRYDIADAAIIDACFDIAESSISDLSDDTTATLKTIEAHIMSAFANARLTITEDD